MKFAFIVNPVSGTGEKAAAMFDRIKEYAEKSDKDIRVYRTEGFQDASVLAASLARDAAEAGESIRIYACGGDGTLNEAANGIFGKRNASLGCVPVGSGNDFVRSIGGKEDLGPFLDVERQVYASPKTIDLLVCTYERGGREYRKIGVNGVNIGFDGSSAILAHRLKSLPLVSGNASYTISVLINFIKKTGQDLRVYAGNELFYDGPLLLLTVANGRFCGGGVESCPRGEMDDGLAELLAVRDISRGQLAKSFPAFRDGRIFELEDFDSLAAYRRARKVTVIPRERPMEFVIDGEIVKADKLTVEVEQSAMHILIPAGLGRKKNEEKAEKDDDMQDEATGNTVAVRRKNN